MCLSVPAQLLSISGDDAINRSGKVSFGGVIKEISLAYVPEALVGSYVLVHVGFAISVIDDDEAQFVYSYLKSNDVDQEQLNSEIT
jgi:hydrogenase expression/formation protein HypC